MRFWIAIFFGLLFAAQLAAQNRVELGYQTTKRGVVWYRNGLPTHKPQWRLSQDTNAVMWVDTFTALRYDWDYKLDVWRTKGTKSGALPPKETQTSGTATIDNRSVFWLSTDSILHYYSFTDTAFVPFDALIYLSASPSNIAAGVSNAAAKYTTSLWQDRDDQKLYRWDGAAWVEVGSGADNWGTQVTQRDSSLQGNGTTASPLGIKGYGAATNGQVPSKAAGGITWIDPGTGTTNLTYSGAGSPVTLNSSSGTDVTFTQGTGISLSATGSDLTITNSDPDQSVTNEGGLTVGAGGANTSTIESNTSGSTPVTVSGSNTILVTEAGSIITLQADTSLVATVNDVNAARNRDDSTFARLPGELYHTKRISSNAYRYGTTGFRTIDTTGVLNIATSGGQKAGVSAINVQNLIRYKNGTMPSWYIQQQSVSNGDGTTNNVLGITYNQFSGSNEETSQDVNFGISLEPHWIAGDGDTVSELHVFFNDMAGKSHRPLTGFFNFHKMIENSWGFNIENTYFAGNLANKHSKVTINKTNPSIANYPLEAYKHKNTIVTTNSSFTRAELDSVTVLVVGNYNTGGESPQLGLSALMRWSNTQDRRAQYYLGLIDMDGSGFDGSVDFVGFHQNSGVFRESFRIMDNTGNFGIGLSGGNRPQRKLHVNGETRITDLTTDTPTRIVGADADGDLNAVTPSAEFSLTASALNLAQQGATTGQLLGWSGSAWVPTTNGNGTVTGTGANDYVAIWTSATNLEGDADFQWDGNKIKISGVPAGQQDVIQITNTNAGTNDQTQMRFWNDSGTTGSDGLLIGLASSGRTAPYTNMGYMWNYENGPVVFAMNNSEKMRVTANGLIIGSTANAANRLDVEGAAVIGATYSGTSAASTNGLLVEGNVGIGNTSAQRKLHVTGEARITDLVTDAPTVIVGADADGDLGTITPTNGLSIDGSGNLAMPTGTIHQTMRHTGTAWAASSEILNDDAAIGIGGSPVSGFELYVNGAQRNDGAYVTRGAGSDYTSNLAAPHVRIWNTTVTTGDTWYLASLNNGDLAFASSNLGGVQMLIENGTGDVGIGNSAPTQKLHITGSARVTGAYYDSNNEPGTSGQVLSSTVTGTDWISAGSGTLNAANNGLYVSGTTVRLGTNPLIEATLIDQDANDMRFYDGKWSYSSRSVSWTPTQGFGLVGTEGSPTTASTPTQDGIAEFSVMNTGNALQSNSLTVGAYATDSEGFWIQSRSNSIPNVPYPLTTQPRGGQFSVGRLSGLDALVTLSATGLAGSTASGSVLHLENVEGNQKAAMTFGVAAGTDVTDGEIAYFDASDIVRVTNRNTTTGTSSFRIAVGGETSDRVTVVASSTTPSARMGVGTTSPHSTLQSAGSVSAACITFTGALTLDERHYRVEYTANTSITITLPAASTCNGRMYVIHHRGTGGTITLSIAINKGNGATFNTLTAGQHVFIHSDGTAWNGIKLNSL